jgi:hypothetical protein
VPTSQILHSVANVALLKEPGKQALQAEVLATGAKKPAAQLEQTVAALTLECVLAGQI